MAYPLPHIIAYEYGSNKKSALVYIRGAEETAIVRVLNLNTRELEPEISLDKMLKFSAWEDHDGTPEELNQILFDYKIEY